MVLLPPPWQNGTVTAAAFRRGIVLFNAGEYFQAHEVWEDVWRAAPVRQKKFFQGLIQVAVALHHYRGGNLAGARSLLARGKSNLAAYPEQYGEIDLAALRRALAIWEEALARGDSLPSPLRLDSLSA